MTNFSEPVISMCIHKEGGYQILKKQNDVIAVEQNEQVYLYQQLGSGVMITTNADSAAIYRWQPYESGYLSVSALFTADSSWDGKELRLEATLKGIVETYRLLVLQDGEIAPSFFWSNEERADILIKLKEKNAEMTLLKKQLKDAEASYAECSLRNERMLQALDEAQTERQKANQAEEELESVRQKRIKLQQNLANEEAELVHLENIQVEIDSKRGQMKDIEYTLQQSDSELQEWIDKYQERTQQHDMRAEWIYSQARMFRKQHEEMKMKAPNEDFEGIEHALALIEAALDKLYEDIGLYKTKITPPVIEHT